MKLFFAVAVALLCLPTLCMFSADAAETDIQILNSNSATKTMIQRIELHPRLRQAKIGKRIGFALPDGKVLTFKVGSVKEAYQGSKVISAVSDEGASLLITMDSKASFGSIRGAGLNYSISHSKELGQILVDQDSDSFPTIDLSNDAIIPPGMSADQPGYLQMGYDASRMRDLAAKEKSIITILVLYSNEFANGFASPLARINQMIAFTNQSYARSGINIEVKLAHAQALSFNNGTALGTLLDQITDGTGSFSGVNAMRNQYGADMVALLPFRNSNSSAGIAWVNGGNPDRAYSVTQMSPNCCDVVFAHELGHNLGSGHERLSVNPSQGSPCRFNFTGYSCGYGNVSAGWGTVMSSGLNRRAANNVFSNPDQSCLGEACGIAQGQPNAADNKTSFNITGPIVAAFRADVVPPPPAPPPSPPTTGDTVIVPMLDLLLDDEG